MDKKIMGLLIGIVAVFLVLVVAAVFMGENSTDVIIGNQTFHIPNGFEESDLPGGTPNTLRTRELRFFKNGNNESFVIAVYHNETIHNLNLSNPVNKTIGGINGVYSTQKVFYKIYKNETIYTFRYQHNNDLISIASPDESLIEQVIM